MAKTTETKKAFAYLRTSSAANVGEGKDSDRRQLEAINRFAKRNRLEMAGIYRDEAVSGEDDIASRPGFSAMLDGLEANGIRTVIVEDASRFARKVLVQELGILALIARDVVCWAASGEMELTNTDDEFKIAMRQIAGAFAQLEKTRLVKKLKAARDRKREDLARRAAKGEKIRVKVEGRKSIAETKPEVIALARRLNRKRPKGGQATLRDISAQLAQAGHVTRTGKSYAPAAVAKMIARD